MGIAADRHAWADYLRAVAEPVLAETPIIATADSSTAIEWIGSFADENGHRRRTDPQLLARLLGITPPTGGVPSDPDEMLWRSVSLDQIDGLSIQGSGPLLVESQKIATIETRTEAELTALHALWNRRDQSSDLRSRCLEAARWHVAELQPDNATGLPWAVHVFVELALATSDPGAQAAALFHAEGLVHAASVMLGRPGLRAACILLDAARELQADIT